MPRALRFLQVLSVLAAVLLVSITAGFPFAAQPAAQQKVVGGPYAVNVGPQSATVMWVVQSGQGSQGSAPWKMDRTAPVLRAQKLSFTNLKPGTKYSYEAFPGEAGKGSYKTPPSGEAHYQFVVYGDTRTRHDVHRSVVNAILKYADPDFVVHTGDLVADGQDTSQWPIFFDIERELLRKAAFFPILGNHERNAKNYFDFLDAKPYYSFEWGSAHFTLIDSDIENAGTTQAERDAFWLKETRWLEEDLKGAQGADFRFLVAHNPPITAVRGRQGDNRHMIALEPMFEKYKLSAGFFGHDHNYQHYFKNGVHYITTGGGGAPLYDVDLPPAGITKKVARTENFVIVKIDGKKARIEALKPTGETIDVTELP